MENVLAACSAAFLAGASPAAIASGVKSFRAVEHRLEWVAEIAGVQFYNDSKATNVDAALKAIDAFPGPLFVILGGRDKGSPYTPLRAPLREKARSAGFNRGSGGQNRRGPCGLRRHLNVRRRRSTASARICDGARALRRCDSSRARVFELRSVRDLRAPGPRVQGNRGQA